MTKTEFLNTLKKLTEEPTLYVYGGFGQFLTEQWKEYFIAHYGFNRSVDAYGRNRRELIEAASSKTRGYDCVCLIKAVLNGNKGYKTEPCPDLSIGGILKRCTNVRTVSNSILPTEGDFLVNDTMGHCGIYIGNGNVIEATYSGSDGVQVKRYAGRGWKWAGELPYLDPEPAPIPYVYGVQVMANKNKSTAKKYLRKGQSIYYVDGLYKNAYIFPTKKECEAALPGVRKTYPDAFITKYSADALVSI